MYTPAQKAKILELQGFDPAQYDIDDQDNIIEKSQLPTRPQAPIPALTTSTVGALGRSAKRSLIPTLTGLAGAGAATALSGGIALPILAGIAGGMAGGYGQEKLVEATSTPEELQARNEQMALDQAQHPYASFGGAIAPQLLAFQPNLANIGRAGRTLLRGGDAVAKANLANVGVGAGLGAVTEGVLPYLQGGEASARDVGLGALAGAAFNKPWLLGSRLFSGGQQRVPEGYTQVERPSLEDLVRPSPTQPSGLKLKPSTEPVAPKVGDADFAKLNELQELSLESGYNAEAMQNKNVKGNKATFKQGMVVPEQITKAREGEVELGKEGIKVNKQQRKLVEEEIPVQETGIEADPYTKLRQNIQDNYIESQEIPIPELIKAAEADNISGPDVERVLQEELLKVGRTPKQEELAELRREYARIAQTKGKITGEPIPIEGAPPKPEGEIIPATMVKGKVVEGQTAKPETPTLAGQPIFTAKELATEKTRNVTPSLSQLKGTGKGIVDTPPANLEGAFGFKQSPTPPPAPYTTTVKGGLKYKPTSTPPIQKPQPQVKGGKLQTMLAEPTAKEPWQMPKAEGDAYLEEKWVNAIKTDEGKVFVKNLEHGDLFSIAEEDGHSFTDPNSRGWAIKGRKGRESYIGIVDVDKAGGDFHKAYVMKALKEGKDVPPEVLKDYPDLVKGGDTQNAQKERVQEVASSQQVGTEVTKVPTVEPPTQGELTPIAKNVEVQQALDNAKRLRDYWQDKVGSYRETSMGLEKGGASGKAIGGTFKQINERQAASKAKWYGDLVANAEKRGLSQDDINTIAKAAKRLLKEDAPKEVQAADTQIRKGLKTKGTKPSKGEAGGIINPGEVIYDALVTVGRHLATIYKDFTAWSKAMLDNYGGEVSKYIKSVWENISGMPSIPALKGKSPETGTPRPYDQIKLGGEGNKVYSDLGTTNPQSLVSKVFGSQTETLRKTGGKGGKVFADAATEQSEVARELFKFSNRMMDALKGLRPAEYNQVYKALIYEGRNKVSMRNQLPEHLRPVYDVARREYKNMGLNQIEAKQPKLQNGVPVERGIDPLAWFETMNRKTLNTIGKYPDSPAAKQLKQDFIDHYKTQGKGESEAIEDFTNLTNALNSKDTNVRFAALRKSEGIGLPDSWIEPDFKQAIKRYVRRFASDRAYYDTIESNPEVMWLLGLDKDSYGRPMPKPANPPGEFGALKLSPEVKSILEQIEGNYARFSPTVNALSRVANALILGPITGMTDIMSTPFNMAKFLPTKELTGMFGTIKNIGQSYRNSLETGINRRDFTTIDELAQVGTELSDEINKLADFLTRATGRQATEIVSRSIAQGMGEYIAKFHQAMAKAGDKASIKLLNEVSPGKDWSKLDYKELGARFAELAQGRYNFTGLPRWANDSLLAPLVKLSRWNIEQAGNFMKYVWEPLKDGNPEPLLISLLGGVVGGTMIKELREYITEKEGNTPTWIEIVQSEGSVGDKIPATAYELMAVMGLVGTAGAFADIIKSGFDTVYKNTPSGYRLPLYETTANVAKNITQATGAILDADSLREVGDIALKLSLNLMSQNVQLLRIGVNNLAVAAPNTMLGKEHKRKGEARDLRVFNMLEGNRQGSGGSADNPYTGLVARRYKLAETPQEALSALGPAINKVRAQSKGNPRKLLRGLDNLKTSASLNYPSPERNPEDFVKFGRFLQGTQGKARADERLESYKRRRAVNRMKSNLLP